MGYAAEAMSDAWIVIRDNVDAIVDHIVDYRVVPDQPYEVGDLQGGLDDSGKDCDLREAAEILWELSEHEETDGGLWEGLPLKEAVCVMASLTYKNAVVDAVRRLLRGVAAEVEIGDFLFDCDDLDTDDAREKLKTMILDAAGN